MFLGGPAIRSRIILILALRTTGSLGVQNLGIGIDVRLGLYALNVKRSPVQLLRGMGIAVRIGRHDEARWVKGDADVGVGPGEVVVTLLYPAVFACLVVPLASCTDGQDTTGEGYVNGVIEPGRFVPQDACFFVGVEKVGVHHGLGMECDASKLGMECFRLLALLPFASLVQICDDGCTDAKRRNVMQSESICRWLCLVMSGYVW